MDNCLEIEDVIFKRFSLYHEYVISLPEWAYSVRKGVPWCYSRQPNLS